MNRVWIIIALGIVAVAAIPEARAAIVGGFDAVVAANLDKYLNAMASGFGCL